MELVAAQDDARAAREETRRVKAELAFLQADRDQVRFPATSSCPLHHSDRLSSLTMMACNPEA